MKIDPEKPHPKYQQLIEIIKQLLIEERYQAGQQLPSESDLIKQFHVSRNTVRQAFAELVNEGVIYKKRGMRSFFSGRMREEQQRSSLIGVMTPIASYIYPQIIQGIDDVVHRHGCNIVLGNSSARTKGEAGCIEQLLERRIEGLLFEPYGAILNFADSPAFQMLHHLTIPVVIMNWAVDIPTISFVSPDDVKGGYLAASYLAQAGHHRIACVYPSDQLPGRHRYQGYREALEAYGIAYDSQFDKSGTITRWDELEYIPGLVKALLAQPAHRPTAIFFFNDAAALRGYPVIRELGLRVPEDISIVGFDNFEPAALTDLSLTSVVHPKDHVGKWAAELLFEAIEQPGQCPPKHILIPPTIAVRGSVKTL